MAAQRESGDNGVTSPWQRQLTTAVTCHRSASGYSNILGTEGKWQLTSDGNSIKIRAVVIQWQWHCSTVPAVVDNTWLQQQVVTACSGVGLEAGTSLSGMQTNPFWKWQCSGGAEAKSGQQWENHPAALCCQNDIWQATINWQQPQQLVGGLGTILEVSWVSFTVLRCSDSIATEVYEGETPRQQATTNRWQPQQRGCLTATASRQYRGKEVATASCCRGSGSQQQLSCFSKRW